MELKGSETQIMNHSSHSTKIEGTHKPMQPFFVIAIKHRSVVTA